MQSGIRFILDDYFAQELLLQKLMKTISIWTQHDLKIEIICYLRALFDLV